MKESDIEKNGKAFLLAYDHGLEHGPKDFDKKNIDPKFLMDLAEEGPFTGVILQKGIAEKYYNSSDIPLILKLNGKSSLNPHKCSSLNCSVERAVDLGADAVGFTIYPGSEYESVMQRDFRIVEEKAREHDLPVILWSYPRGEGIDDKSEETVAYAARIALELGADYVKVKYPGSEDSFERAVKNAGRTKVLCSGGSKKSDKEIKVQIKSVIEAGASGVAVGRNIWQREKSLEFSREIAEILWNEK